MSAAGPLPEVEVERLAAWLGDRLGFHRPHIVDLRRHSEGFSWQTYTGLVVDDTARDRSWGFAVRRQPEDGLLAPYDIEAQFNLHTSLTQSPIPVPQLLDLEKSAEVLGMPFYAMERVEGEVPVQWNAHDHSALLDPSDRSRIGHKFIEIMAMIHTHPVEQTGLAPADGSPPAIAAIDHWEQFIDESIRVDIPLLRVAIAWCRNHLVDSERVTLCHGDYRIGNFMVADRDIVAILDWELAHAGDPVEDLAWAALPLFRGRSPLMSHLLPIDEALQLYQSFSGQKVSSEALHFWTVLGLIKAAAPHLRAASAFEGGKTNDLRLAAMGHQVSHILRVLNSLIWDT